MLFVCTLFRCCDHLWPEIWRFIPTTLDPAIIITLWTPKVRMVAVCPTRFLLFSPPLFSVKRHPQPHGGVVRSKLQIHARPTGHCSQPALRAALTRRMWSGATETSLLSASEYIIDLDMCFQGSMVLGAA